MNRLLPLAAGMLLALACCGCGSGQAEPETQPVAERKIRIVATTGVIADLAKNVGGSRVEVTALMGPGIDPHPYKAAEDDIRLLSDADLILYHGLNLEAKMGDIFVKMARRGKATLAVAVEGIEKRQLRELPGLPGQLDPHVWLDAGLWAQSVQPVVETLTRLDPVHFTEFAANGGRYRQSMVDLHGYCKRELASILKAKRVLVTAHDAFGYFGRAYGVEVVGRHGTRTKAGYGPKDTARLRDLIISRRLKAIFVESSVSQKSIESVVAGCRGRGHQVLIGGTLFSDAMGAPGTPDGNYLGMVRHNVDTIVRALR